MNGLEMALILLRQCVEIFLLFSLGFLLRRVGMISVETARQMCSVVMMVVSPLLLILLLQKPLDSAGLPLILTAAVLTILFYLLAIPLTRLLFPVAPDHLDRIKRMGTIASNVGFVGVPLIHATVGESGMLYTAIYIVLFNVHIWTHGINMLRGDRRIRWKEVITCPALIGAVVGMVFFLCSVRLPLLATETMNYIASMNTPLPTILTGVFISELPIRRIITDKRVYFPCFVRLVLLPALFIGLLWLIRAPEWFAGARKVALVIAICAACPVGMSTMMMPARLGQDVTFGSNLIAQSNLFCIVTLPLVAIAAQAAFA